MGVTMQEQQAVTREYKPRYQEATKKSKQALLDEFTRLTGCHRTSAVRLLAALVYSNGRPVKLKPEQKRPANRKGKGSPPMRLSAASISSGHSSGISAGSYWLRSCGSKCPLSPPGRHSASLPQSRKNSAG
jgi:hypothetical protein